MDSTGNLHVVKKTKNRKRLVATVSCLIIPIPSKNSNKPVDPPKEIGVMAIVAIMKSVTEKMSLKGPQIPLRSYPSNKIQVFVEKGSNRHQFIMKKENPNLFPT